MCADIARYITRPSVCECAHCWRWTVLAWDRGDKLPVALFDLAPGHPPKGLVIRFTQATWSCLQMHDLRVLHSTHTHAQLQHTAWHRCRHGVDCRRYRASFAFNARSHEWRWGIVDTECLSSLYLLPPTVNFVFAIFLAPKFMFDE